MSEPTSSPPADAAAAPAAAPQTPAAAENELEPQLKYERLGADVKSILSDATATCLCLSEKVLALGTSAGTIHILDYSGNEVGGWVQRAAERTQEQAACAAKQQLLLLLPGC
jgi:hypothetical protein